MALVCPACQAAIPLTDVNIEKDVALCRGCERPHVYSQIHEPEEWPASVDVSAPPPARRFVGMALRRSLGLGPGLGKPLFESAAPIGIGAGMDRARP